jgi:hypothetical protein
MSPPIKAIGWGSAELKRSFWARYALVLRQHERSTRADRVVTEPVQMYIRGEPIVRHLVYVTADTVGRITDDDQRLTSG